MRTSVAPVIAAGLVILAACSSGSSGKAKAQSTTTSAPTTAPARPDTQVWLCKPGQTPNPCLADLTTTVITADGTKTVQESPPAADPKIDCFYVYPTVSQQKGPNADLTIDVAQTSVAIAQASRYSQTCRVFAPMYRQVTIAGLNNRTEEPGRIAFQGVLAAWNDYLDRYNVGRGVVLIGHSQGSFVLRQLISQHIDADASVRSRIVSAILLGGNVLVPAGKDGGGDFKNLPACESASQIGCVIVFSAFDEPPPAASLFGRAREPGRQVLCTNPAALGGGSGPLDPYFPTHLEGLFGVGNLAGATTPWVSYPELFTGECKSEGSASWLQVTDVRKAGNDRVKLQASLGPTWGLHLYDGNIALGNLTEIVKSEAAAYVAAG